MKTLTKRAALGAMLAALAAAPVALAGTKITSQVSITATRASGSLGTARKSADALQYIGCNVIGSSGGAVTAYCYARDAAGATAACSTSDPTLIQVALGLNGDDFFEFHWQNTGSGNACTVFNVGKYSSYEPK